MFQGVLSLALTRLAEDGIPWSNGNRPYQVRLKLRWGTPFSSKFWDKSSKFSADRYCLLMIVDRVRWMLQFMDHGEE